MKQYHRSDTLNSYNEQTNRKMYETGADWTLERNWWKKTKIIQKWKVTRYPKEDMYYEKFSKRERLEMKKSRKLNWN